VYESSRRAADSHAAGLEQSIFELLNMTSRITTGRLHASNDRALESAARDEAEIAPE
jgi:hypothetical protein